MDSEKKFRTKTGYCHILDDKIVLTRDGIIGNIAEVAAGGSIFQSFIIYGLISIGLIYVAIDNFIKQDYFIAIIFTLLTVYLIYGILSSLNNSATPVIERQSIKEIKFKKGIIGITRTRFEVYFKDTNGKIKKRLIMLPGSLTGGTSETDIAYKMMLDEKLIEK
jgi:hypothetical protein